MLKPTYRIKFKTSETGTEKYHDFKAVDKNHAIENLKKFLALHGLPDKYITESLHEV